MKGVVMPTLARSGNTKSGPEARKYLMMLNR